MRARPEGGRGAAGGRAAFGPCRQRLRLFCREGVAQTLPASPLAARFLRGSNEMVQGSPVRWLGRRRRRRRLSSAWVGASGGPVWLRRVRAEKEVAVFWLLPEKDVWGLPGFCGGRGEGVDGG